MTAALSGPAQASALAHEQKERLGRSRLEQLPLEIIHEIHFSNPDNVLLAVSKTMASKFTPASLPVTRTARWVTHLWETAFPNGGVEDERQTQDEGHRSQFILSRRYTHTPVLLRRIMVEMHKDPRATLYDMHFPPLDPSLFLYHGGRLGSDLIHHLYHTYPTDPNAMTEAVRLFLLLDRPEADILLECGADPRLSIGSSAYDMVRINPVADRRVREWTPEHLAATECKTCGWKGTPATLTRIQTQYVSEETDAASVTAALAEVKERAANDPRLELALALDAGSRPVPESYMTPANGTVGKIPVLLPKGRLKEDYGFHYFNFWFTAADINFEVAEEVALGYMLDFLMGFLAFLDES